MDNVASIHPDEELGKFFDYMYGEETGYAYSPTKGETFEQYFFSWPTERAELIQHVRRHTLSSNVYYSPALFSEPNATKSSFKGTRVLWAEFDGSLPESLENLPEPGLKVRSSTENHEHWYWQLDRFETNQTALETVTQRLAYHLKADLACWNSNRVLRPPGTRHHDSGLTTRVLHWDSRTTNITEFVSLPELPISLLQESDLGNIPTPIEVIALNQFTIDEITFFLERKIEVGHRSSALAKLGHIAMEKNLTNAEAMSLLLNADGRWGKFAGRTDQRHQLLGIINYCRAKHPIDPVAEEAKATSKFKVYTYDEFINSTVKLEWIIPNFLHKKGVISVSGPSGIGKSQFSLRFAEALATGKKFLKWQPEVPCRTVFVSMEMPHEELLFFLEKMKMENNDLLRENFLLLPLGQSLKMNNKSAQHEINKIMEEFEPTGIIFDSLGKGIGQDIGTEEAMLQAFEYIDRTIRDQFNSFAWFIHHPRKGQVGNKKPNTLDDLYGSQYYGANVTNAVSLWPEHSQIEVSCLKLRLAKEFEAFRVNRTPDLNFKIASNGPQGLANGFTESDFSNGI